MLQVPGEGGGWELLHAPPYLRPLPGPVGVSNVFCIWRVPPPCCVFLAPTQPYHAPCFLPLSRPLRGFTKGEMDSAIVPASLPVSRLLVYRYRVVLSVVVDVSKKCVSHFHG